MSAAVANASLDLFDTGEPLKQVQKIESRLMQAVSRFAQYKNLANIRFKGTVLAMEYVQSKSPYESVDPEKRIGQKIYLQSLKNGLMLRPLGNTIYLFLPLCTTEEELDDILNRCDQTFAHFA